MRLAKRVAYDKSRLRIDALGRKEQEYIGVLGMDGVQLLDM